MRGHQRQPLCGWANKRFCKENPILPLRDCVYVPFIILVSTMDELLGLHFICTWVFFYITKYNWNMNNFMGTRWKIFAFNANLDTMCRYNIEYNQINIEFDNIWGYINKQYAFYIIKYLFWSFIDIIKKQKLIRYKILEKIIRLGRD